MNDGFFDVVQRMASQVFVDLSDQDRRQLGMILGPDSAQGARRGDDQERRDFAVQDLLIEQVDYPGRKAILLILSAVRICGAAVTAGRSARVIRIDGVIRIAPR